MWCLWLIAAAIFFIIEIITVGFLIFWLGIGALVAMIVSFITDSILIQTGVFVVVSAILIPLTKPFVDKYLDKKTIPTNSNSLINKHGIVIKEINSTESSGLVKVDSQVWSAKSEDNQIISEGTEIEVLRIDGVKLIVSKIYSNSTLN